MTHDDPSLTICGPHTERRNRFIATVVRAVLSRLVGWRYDGTDAARRRLVVQPPMLAFR